MPWMIHINITHNSAKYSYQLLLLAYFEWNYKIRFFKIATINGEQNDSEHKITKYEQFSSLVLHEVVLLTTVEMHRMPLNSVNSWQLLYTSDLSILTHCGSSLLAMVLMYNKAHLEFKGWTELLENEKYNPTSLLSAGSLTPCPDRRWWQGWSRGWEYGPKTVLHSPGSPAAGCSLWNPAPEG